MPVILGQADYDLWLDPGMRNVAVSETLKPYDAQRMRCYPVSRRVNHVLITTRSARHPSNPPHRKARCSSDNSRQVLTARFLARFFVMRSLRKLAFVPLLGALLCASCVLTLAETGILVVHVKDVQERPIAGLQIGVKGDGGSATTGDDGKARIPLAKHTKENDWVSLQILHSPPGKDFMMVSPWDYGTFVPSFANESGNFVEIVVVQRGDLIALKSGAVLKALAAQINKANAPGGQQNQVVSPTETLTTSDNVTVRKNAMPLPEDKGQRIIEPEKQAVLAEVASSFGMPAEEIDKAIRAWGAKATDPYEAGLASLYERNYAKASSQLSDSLQIREDKLAADQKAVADAAFFLGMSLYEEGKYRDSAFAFRRCLQLRPDNDTVLSNLAVSLLQAGDYTAAELPIERALAIREKTFGPDHPLVAIALNNLAGLRQSSGDYTGAELLYRRALSIDEKTLGPDHPRAAMDLNNLAMLLEAKGNYAEAEPLLRRVLVIDEKALGPNHYDTARDLNNLAMLLQNRGDYAGAEPLYRLAIAVGEKASGPDHPDVAKYLSNLAELLQAKGDYTEAEPLFRRSLAIIERALGPDHPDVATSLSNLAELLQAEGRYTEAEPLLRRALTIDVKALGPSHPLLAGVLNNLGELLREKGERAEAEPLLRRALAIDEKALGPDHPDVATVLNNLANLLNDRGDYAAAEPLYRRALAICEKSLGPNHPRTQQLRQSLKALSEKSEK
jgi:tetratricopeptide (TPR) repeat protein